MNDSQRIIDFIHYAERLKTELRRASRSDNNRESVAEHCWRLLLFAMLVIPKLKVKVDFLKALKMGIIHDLVEIEAKDVPVLESVANEDRSRLKYEEELKAMIKIRDLLGDDGQEVYDLWIEFEEQKTNEAKVMRSLDWIEGQMQFLSETVTTFAEDNPETINILFEKTIELCKVDPFISELYEKSLPQIKDRVKK